MGYNRGIFEHIMVKLVAKLDAVQAADGPRKSEKTKGYGYHNVTPGFTKYYEKAKPFMSGRLPVITG